ncbi:hypothetical protein U1499_13810 [Aeromonas caviae]|uniref:hypothetical protein n=1 Tax=Aeromonas caviae TaxID=648 RepID=UPI0030156B12
MDSIITKYKGKQLDLESLSCFTMLMEWLGKDPSVVQGKFKTILGAKRKLPKLLGHKTISEYLASNGCDELENWRFLQDGDLVVFDGINSYLYQYGYLFGVSPYHHQSFNYIHINTVIESLHPDSEIRVYRKIKQ